MASALTARVPRGRERLHAAPDRAHALIGVTLVAVVALSVGIWRRDELDLSPDSGLGYALGIIGLAAMTALLLYSVRKRARLLRAAGPLRLWFHVHMALGVIGPVAILFHANFRASSVNATVALASMLLVAGSGFVGRFLYTRVHVGLFGHRESLRALTLLADSSRSALHDALRATPAALARVQAYEGQALEAGRGGVGQLARLASLGLRTRRAQRAARQALRERSRDPALVAALREHLALVRRVASFACYERVLSIWHAVHLPLCIVLFVAAAVHVVAVHLY